VSDIVEQASSSRPARVRVQVLKVVSGSLSRPLLGMGLFILVFLGTVNALRVDAYWGVVIAYCVAAAAGYVVFRDWRTTALWPLIPLVLMAPFSIPAYAIAPILLFSIVALGTNLLTGYTGQISIAQGTSVGIGAYATGLLMVNEHWNFWYTVPVAVIVSGLLGLVIAIPAARLSGVYQVMTSLAVAVSFAPLAVFFNDLTNGNLGVNVILTPNEPGWLSHIVTMSSTQFQYMIGVVLLAALLFIAWNVVRRYPGRALRAVRDHDIVASVVGVNVARYKVLSFVIAGMFAGAAGALYAITIGVISPTGFDLFYSIEFIVIIVVGGQGTLSGGIIGSIFFWELTSRVQQVTIPGSNVELSDQVIYGVILIVALIFLRGGLVSLVTKLANAFATLVDRLLPRATKAVAHAPVDTRLSDPVEPPMVDAVPDPTT
jgi:branched-chain amino acid transport system permease protein